MADPFYQQEYNRSGLSRDFIDVTPNDGIDLGKNTFAIGVVTATDGTVAFVPHSEKDKPMPAIRTLNCTAGVVYPLPAATRITTASTATGIQVWVV